MRKYRFAGAVMAVAASLPAGAWAHHSTTAYDLTRTMTLTGTVKRFEWTNPHSWIDVEVPDGKGGGTVWAIEFGAPNLNAREGWHRDDVKVGDKVTMVIYPVRTGTAHGTLGKITLPDGRTLSGAADFLAPNKPAAPPAATNK